jgi:uncharacterized membrane protein YecN with MAPEG domain
MDLKLFSITLLILIALYIRLTAKVIGFRQKNKIPTGDNNEIKFRNAIRSHANCAEYLPILLLELYIMSSLNVNAIIFSILCLAAIGGRVLHAYGLNHLELKTPAIYKGRIYGMVLTFFCLATSALMILIYSFQLV